MSYNDTYAVCVKNGTEVYMTLHVSPGDVVACPTDILYVSRATLTALYELSAATLGKSVTDVTAEEMFVQQGFTDVRVLDVGY